MTESKERTLLRRTVEALSYYEDEMISFDLEQVRDDARALLAAPEAEEDDSEFGPVTLTEDDRVDLKGMNLLRPRPTRQEAEEMVEAYKDALLMYYDRDRTIMHAEPARAALTDFVERLTAGEEAELEHFERRSDGDHITFFFPRETCGHPFRFAGAGVRVTPLDGGTDG